MVIRSFAGLDRMLRGRALLRPAMAGTGSTAMLDALVAAVTGNGAAIRAMLPAALADRVTVLDTPDSAQAASLTVAAIRSGGANMLAKGQMDSAVYLRAVVARDTGLRGSGVLSNLTLAEMPSVPGLIGATDNGILPLPTLDQKRAIIANAAVLFHALGVNPLRAAALAASEKVSGSQPATTDAAALAAEGASGAFAGALVDGLFGHDVALSDAAARKKDLENSSVAGRADRILFPSINAGNATVKSWKLHGQARTASIAPRARVPVLVDSRAEGTDQRLPGFLLARALLATQGVPA